MTFKWCGPLVLLRFRAFCRVWSLYCSGDAERRGRAATHSQYRFTRIPVDDTDVTAGRCSNLSWLFAGSNPRLRASWLCPPDVKILLVGGIGDQHFSLPRGAVQGRAYVLHLFPVQTVKRNHSIIRTVAPMLRPSLE